MFMAGSHTFIDSDFGFSIIYFEQNYLEFFGFVVVIVVCNVFSLSPSYFLWVYFKYTEFDSGYSYCTK